MLVLGLLAANVAYHAARNVTSTGSLTGSTWTLTGTGTVTPSANGGGSIMRSVSTKIDLVTGPSAASSYLYANAPTGCMELERRLCEREARPAASDQLGPRHRGAPADNNTDQIKIPRIFPTGAPGVTTTLRARVGSYTG
jgi:hypothetical protein